MQKAKTQPKTITVRLAPEILEKFRHVCDWKGRTPNGQLQYYVQRQVERFEERNGPIRLGERKP